MSLLDHPATRRQRKPRHGPGPPAAANPQADDPDSDEELQRELLRELGLDGEDVELPNEPTASLDAVAATGAADAAAAGDCTYAALVPLVHSRCSGLIAYISGAFGAFDEFFVKTIKIPF